MSLLDLSFYYEIISQAYISYISGYFGPITRVSQIYISYFSPISQLCFRYICFTGLSQAYIKYISGISQVYFRYILVISQLYQAYESSVRYTYGIFQVCFKHISCVFQSYLRGISGICLVYLMHSRGISKTYLGNISGIYQVYPRHIWGISKKFLKHILIQGISYISIGHTQDNFQTYLIHLYTSKCVLNDGIISFNVILLLILDTEILAAYAGSCFLSPWWPFLSPLHWMWHYMR